MNEFRVIANRPLEFAGEHYDTGAVITMHCDQCAPLLINGTVRLENTPEPKRRRGRPRKSDTAPNTYQRKDLTAE